MDKVHSGWRKGVGRYVSGEDYCLGRVRVGGVFYNGGRSRGDPRAYRASVDLPGVRLTEGATHHEKEEDAKAVVERVVATWLGWLQESPAEAA